EGEARRQLVLVRQLGAADDVGLIDPLAQHAYERRAGVGAADAVAAGGRTRRQSRRGEIAVAELLAADPDLVAQGADRQVVRHSLEIPAPVHVRAALAVAENVPGGAEARRQVAGE